MRQLILLALAPIALACASMGPPPGGPEDQAPPRIVALSPDTNARSVTSREISITFDEVIQEPTRVGGRSSLERMLIISPDPGDLDIEWRRNRLTIAAKRGFRPNTAYRVTLLPGISDLVNHPMTAKTSWVFSTGGEVPTFHMSGRVFDWVAERPAPGAVVRAVLRTSPGDSVVYWTISDSTGAFSIEPIEEGAYEVRGFLDGNANRRLDAREKESGIKPVQSAVRPTGLELLLVERDTAPPRITTIDILDSVSVQLTFDKPIDPFVVLQPVLVRVQRPDSSELLVTGVVQRAADQAQRRAAAARAAMDSAAARAAAGTDSAGGRGQPPPGGRGAPPPAAAPRDSTVPRPSAAPPYSSIVVYLAPSNPIARDQEVRVTVRALRGVGGAAGPTTMTAKRPR